MIARFALRIAKLIAICMMIAAVCNAMTVIQEIIELSRSVESGGAWGHFARSILVWVLVVTGALGVLKNKGLGYYVIYLATLVSIFGKAFSYIPFSSFWLPKPLTHSGRELVGIWLVNLVVVAVLVWCHNTTRTLRHDPRLKELRQQSKK